MATSNYDEQNKAVGEGIDAGLTPMEAYNKYQASKTSYPRYDTSTDYKPTVVTSQDTVIDEDSIRKQEEERIAQQIKAIEGVYAGEISKAKKQGAERVGQTTAMSTVRGGAGSDFAQTAKTNIESANTQAEQAILAQMNAEIAAARAQGGSNERAAIQAAYENAASKKALADTAIEAEKNKFSDAQTIASTAAQSGVPYANLDAATREILSKYYGTGAEAVYNKLGESVTKGVEVSSGASYIDPTTGKLIYQSPSKTTSPITKTIGKTLYQYDEATNSWKQVIGSGISNVSSSNKTTETGADFGTITEPSASTEIVDKNGKRIKLTAGQVDTISGFENALQQIQEATPLLNQVNTGPIAGRWSDVARQFNIDDPNRVSLDAKLNNIKAQFLKAISGAAVSESEVKRLSKFLPSINDTEQVIKTKMTELQNAIETQKSNYLKTIGAVNQTSKTTRLLGPDGVQYDVPNENVESFLKEGGKRI